MKIKRLPVLFLLIVSLVISVLPVSAFAAGSLVASGTCGDSLNWTLDEGGVLRVSGSGAMWDFSTKTSSTAPAVPWAAHKTSIKSVVIESGVTHIGNYAYSRCSALETITLPAGLTSVGKNAFEWCAKLTAVELPAGCTTIGSNMFLGCSGLTSVTLPQGMTAIPTMAFSGCASLTALILPDSIKTIGLSSLAGCEKLGKLTLPANLETISDNAITGCASLVSLTIPAKVTSVGSNFINNCPQLKQLVFAGNAPSTSSRAVNNPETVMYYPAGNDTWTDAATNKITPQNTWKAYCADGHSAAALGAVAPTCTNLGYTAGQECRTCGLYLTVPQLVQPTGHTPEAVPGREATCYQEGLGESVRCSVCGMVLSAPRPYPKTEHEIGDLAAKAPTCTETGLTAGTGCKNCDYATVPQEVIPSLGHEYTDDADQECNRCGEKRESEPATITVDIYVVDSSNNATLLKTVEDVNPEDYATQEDMVKALYGTDYLRFRFRDNGDGTAMLQIWIPEQDVTTVNIDIYIIDSENNATLLKTVENVDLSAYASVDHMVQAIYEGKIDHYVFRDMGDGTAVLRIWPAATEPEPEPAATVNIDVYTIDPENNATLVKTAENIDLSDYATDEDLVKALYDGEYLRFRLREMGDGTAVLHIWIPAPEPVTTVNIDIYIIDSENNATLLKTVENVDLTAYASTDHMVQAIYEGKIDHYVFRDMGDGTAVLRIWPAATEPEPEPTTTVNIDVYTIDPENNATLLKTVENIDLSDYATEEDLVKALYDGEYLRFRLREMGDGTAVLHIWIPAPEPEPEPEPEPVETTAMYRLYNPNSGEHFYTGSIQERNNLVMVGWQYEGVAWNAPTKIGAPVYRLFNPNSGDHHYTMSAEERDNLVNVGWIYEGVAWNSASADNLPQYRLYNPNADCGSHHYTGSEEERDNLVEVGWIYEGIGWFGLLK